MTDRVSRTRNTQPTGEPDVFAPADVFAAAPQARPTPTFAVLPPDPCGTPDAASVLAEVGEAVYEWTLANDALTWSPNAGDVLGVRDLSVLSSGKAYAKLHAPGGTETRFDAIVNAPSGDRGQGVRYQIQYALMPPGADAPLWIEDTGRWTAGPDGRPERARGVVRAINERHAQEERLAYLSRFDSLTGEMNRLRLTEVLGTALQEAIQQRSSCGFMLAAIDNLAQLNEAYGFDIADEVIGAVARRLRSKLRAGDSIGRFSGNKFGIVLNNCFPDDMDVASERLLACVREDVVRTSAGPLAVTVTVGGVAAPRHAQTVDEVLARAQEALAAGKSRRRGSFLAYRPNPEREALRRENVRIADEIVTALNERRMLLAFEPVVETGSRQPAFYECLMRIRRADGVIVPAGQVIPVAERLGLVRMLDHRVLELLITKWPRCPRLAPASMSRRVSTLDPAWWSTMSALLRTNTGVAERLVVEITETTAIQDIDDARGFVARVKDLGCRIAIDDFGSGYTSFRNLRRLGVDLLKIDGAFVQA